MLKPEVSLFFFFLKKKKGPWKRGKDFEKKEQYSRGINKSARTNKSEQVSD